MTKGEQLQQERGTDVVGKAPTIYYTCTEKPYIHSIVYVHGITMYILCIYLCTTHLLMNQWYVILPGLWITEKTMFNFREVVDM